ncbi:uncharacterized protein DSM5745_09160 [Aspergillus mulundensis]|uniref:Uncharacterized protein n=1 Tax=Aspergillus mulundensis TaxID=1810919 RepID=A0A3D8R0D8_9EURO|nr:hypothetical protein DSM5745_09160 [Aspergillus mulundensis]RDW67294.1 hypothetical protein DSM5745_09160 [Aspergillus mulundensis]
MLQLWSQAVQSPTKTLFESRWRAFKRAYRQPMYKDLLQYIEEEWLQEDTRKFFLAYYTNTYPHFGQISTSRVESAHRRLKKDLESSQSEPIRVVTLINSIIEAQYTKAQHQHADNTLRPPPRYRHLLFKDIVTKVSTYAMQKVIETMNFYLPERLDKPIKRCTGSYKRSLGLPCIHQIQEALHDNRSLGLEEFHDQWLLVPRSRLLAHPQRPYIYPPPKKQQKGRPRGALNQPKKSTKQDLSEFEHTNQLVENGGEAGVEVLRRSKRLQSSAAQRKE